MWSYEILLRIHMAVINTLKLKCVIWNCFPKSSHICKENTSIGVYKRMHTSAHVHTHTHTHMYTHTHTHTCIHTRTQIPSLTKDICRSVVWASPEMSPFSCHPPCRPIAYIPTHTIIDAVILIPHVHVQVP